MLGCASLVSCVHEETRAAGLWAKFERTTVTQRVHDGALVTVDCGSASTALRLGKWLGEN